MRLVSAIVAVITLSLPLSSQAVIVITAAEHRGDITFTYRGTLDLTGLGTPQGPPANAASEINPEIGAIQFGNGDIGQMQFWDSTYTFPQFGTGSDGSPDTVTGPGFSIYCCGSFGVHVGYESNTFISGSMSWTSDTFDATLLPGNYVIDLPSDTIRLIIPGKFGHTKHTDSLTATAAVESSAEPATVALTSFPEPATLGLTSVPEPATLALLGIGLAGLGLSRRAQRPLPGRSGFSGRSGF
jgi:hypothetical protein